MKPDSDGQTLDIIDLMKKEMRDIREAEISATAEGGIKV